MEVRPRITFLVTVVACSLLVVPAYGQVLPSFDAIQTEGIVQQLQRQQQQRALLPITLEGALDPETYIVGPGDEFMVSIGGGMSREMRPMVSADGYLVIPEAGRFEVAGRTLAEVNAQIRPALQRLFRNVPTELALVHPRMFFVHVTGAVSVPGRHLVGPIPRVDDAVRLAMGNQNPHVMLQELDRAIRTGASAEMLPALRNVRVSHTDGTSTSIDLRLYYASGESTHNPFLRDGDVVNVPSFAPYQNAVYVEGAVQSPGTYDYRPGDSVLSLLNVASGPENVRTLDAVRLVRGDGNPTSTTISVAELLSGTVPAPELRPGDRLIVQPMSPELGSVAVQGRVQFPGTYTVRIGRTTVGELLDMAGGLRSDALLQGAYIERRGTTRPQLSGEETNRRRVLEEFLAGSERPPHHLEVELALAEEAFGSLRLADLDYSSRQYLLSELRRTPRMPIDLEAVLRGEATDVLLRDGDRLIVPEDPGGIYVFGQVVRSGFVPYQSGRSTEDYLAAAGGRTTGATEVFVRRAGTGLIVAAAEAGTINAGDEIFVDRRPMSETAHGHQINLQESSIAVQRRQQWIQVGSVVLSTVTAIFTALILSR